MSTKSVYAKVVGFSWIGWIFDFYDLILYSFLLIWIQKEFSFSNDEIGLVYSASLAITAVGGIVLGWCGDRLGRRNAIILSVLIFSVGTFFSAFAWDLWSLLVFRLITGFGIGGEWAAGHTLVNETLPKGQRAKASAFIQSGAPIGSGLAALMGGFITPHIGWRWSFIVASIPSIIIVILMIFSLPESPKYIIFKTESRDYHPTVQGNKVPAGIPYIRHALHRSIQDISSIKEKLGFGIVLSFFGMMAYWVIFSWTPKYLSDLGFSDETVGIWLIIANTGAFLGYISFGYVNSWTGHFKFTFLGYALLFSVGTLLFTSFVTITPDLSLIGVFLLGVGTGFFSGYGPLYSKIFPTKVRNTSSSLCFNTGRLGAFLAPLLVSYLAHQHGFAYAMASGAVFGLLTGLWVLLAPLSKASDLDSAPDEANSVSLNELVIIE